MTPYSVLTARVRQALNLNLNLNIFMAFLDQLAHTADSDQHP